MSNNASINDTALITWPPLFFIRKHRRARHVKIKVTKTHQLEITVPYRFNIREIPAILEENRSWITKHLQRLQPWYPDVLPEKIDIHFLRQSWTVTYMACQSRLKLVCRPDNEIVLMGDVHNHETCKTLLGKWLKQQAKLVLIPLLEKLSLQTGLQYKHVTIRNQKSLWGSCTCDKAINLNYKLIFLPPELVTYVMIHELCHLRHLNHSPQFWALVAQFDPAWQDHRRSLRGADQYIAPWL